MFEAYVEVYCVIRLAQCNFIGLVLVCAVLYSNKIFVSAYPAFQDRRMLSHKNMLTTNGLSSRRNGHHRSLHCPIPHNKITSEICASLPCTSDSDCEESTTKCCFNGCIFTCKHWYQHKTPIIDWMTRGRETRDRQEVDLQDIDYEVKTGEDLIERHNGETFLGETCTTTVDDEGNQPLECPHGYICHVENIGDPDRGVPDSGRCMISREHLDLSESINDYSYA